MYGSLSQYYFEDASPWDFDLNQFTTGKPVDLIPIQFIKRLNELWDAGLYDDPEAKGCMLTLGAFAARLIQTAYAIRTKRGTLELTFAARQFADS